MRATVPSLINAAPVPHGYRLPFGSGGNRSWFYAVSAWSVGRFGDGVQCLATRRVSIGLCRCDLWLARVAVHCHEVAREPRHEYVSAGTTARRVLSRRTKKPGHVLAQRFDRDFRPVYHGGELLPVRIPQQRHQVTRRPELCPVRHRSPNRRLFSHTGESAGQGKMSPGGPGR